MIKRLLNGAALFSCAAIIAFFLTPVVASAQDTNGSITIQTRDATKALLPGTHLVLRDTDTGVTREGTTLSSGAFSFGALPPTTYQLTVEHEGFSTVSYDSIVVTAGVATPLDITLKVGSTNQKIDVSAVSAPVIETSSNQLSTSIDITQVNNLPLQGRSLLSFQALTPGYTSATSTGTGTFNGTANASYGASIDGVNSTSLRMDSGNGPGASITFRIENIQEFTVQAGELDPSQGGGRSASQSLFVTNRGTNKFHGRAFEDFQNAWLNANTWSSGGTWLPSSIAKGVTPVKKGHLILNDFGVSVGGPIWKNRLFFFGSYTQNISPNTQQFSPVVPTAAAQQGNYTYIVACPTGQSTCPTVTNTINVLQFAKNAGLDNAVNAATTLDYELIKTSYQYGSLSNTNTQYNTQNLTFLTPLKTTRYFPAARFDYSLTKKIQLNLSGNMSKNITKGQYPGNFPGPYFQQKYTGSSGDSYVLSLGMDYTITPTVLNQLKLGFLYTNGYFSPEAANYCTACQGALAQGFGLTNPIITYGLGGNYYPYLTLSDDVSWQKGAHTFKFGGTAWHQQDHYYNAPLGYDNITLGMSSIDPAYGPIESQLPTGALAPANVSGAQGDIAGLYAYLNGRVSNVANQLPVNLKTGTYGPPGGYNLDEVALGGGVYAMDTWRARPGFTINYGLRWDFIGDQHDVKAAYTGPSNIDLFGSSGYLNFFQPGASSGPANPLFTTSAHKYHANLVLPQPQIGFAWNPSGSDDSWASKLLGQNKSVIRASFTIKNYTEGGQNFWNNASNAGYNFFNTGSVAASNSTGPQFYAPGTVHLVAPSGYVPGVTDPTKACPDPIQSCVNVSTEAAGVIPPLLQTPSTYQTTIAQSSLFFKSVGGVAAINPYIKQPYTESWSFGFQRQITRTSALEIRYVGNRTIHDWLNLNYNEVNGLNNGFLQDFQAAQKNLAINAAAGKPNDFTPYAGGPAEPILSAAFAGSSASNFKNSSYITFLNNGSLGGLAAAVANNQTFYCNVVGKQFAPCAAAVPTAPATSVFPSNLFMANPYMESRTAYYLDSVGTSNYNSLQVEFRQRVTHGLALNGNYTYGKILGIAQQGGISSVAATIFTLHNLRYNYVPSAYDIRNTFHLSGTYDLPFGTGKMFLSNGRLLNYVVGGWTMGGIFVYQSGAPSLLTGGLTSTVNSASDGGTTFVGGATAKTIQSQVHIRPSTLGNQNVNFLPASLQGPSSANKAVVVPNTTPGVIGNLNYIYGPKWNNFSMALTKDMPLFERVHMNFQAEFLNLPNHPAWLLGTTNVSSASFGTTASLANSPRRIELRGNIIF
jgi:carboxypeptidase family protein